MPIGWGSALHGKARVLDKIDSRIRGLKEVLDALEAKAGKVALSQLAGNLEKMKADYALIKEKLSLLTEIRNEVSAESDLEW